MFTKNSQVGKSDDSQNGSTKKAKAAAAIRKFWKKATDKTKQGVKKLTAKVSETDFNMQVDATIEKLKNEFTVEKACKDSVDKWAEKLFDKSVKGLKDEFEKMDNAAELAKCSVFEANKKCNLYDEVKCIDANRVVVKNSRGNDYIHANYVNTSSEKQFICAQMPFDVTVEQFLRMVLQEKTEFIVMLCGSEELRDKRGTYFPKTTSEKAFTAGDITVTCIQFKLLKQDSNVEIRSLELKKGASRHVVRHIHWKDWPADGFPEALATPMYLIAIVRDSEKPVIVHCSDGAGRSGALVLLEVMVQKFLRGESCEDPIVLVKEIRAQRAKAVKTVKQYIYLHRVLTSYLHELKFLDMSQHLLEFIDDYDRFVKKSRK